MVKASVTVVFLFVNFDFVVASFGKTILLIWGQKEFRLLPLIYQIHYYSFGVALTNHAA